MSVALFLVAHVGFLGFEHDEALTLGRAVAEGSMPIPRGFPWALPSPTPKGVKEQRRKMSKEETQ